MPTFPEASVLFVMVTLVLVVAAFVTSFVWALKKGRELAYEQLRKGLDAAAVKEKLEESFGSEDVAQDGRQGRNEARRIGSNALKCSPSGCVVCVGDVVTDVGGYSLCVDHFRRYPDGRYAIWGLRIGTGRMAFIGEHEVADIQKSNRPRYWATPKPAGKQPVRS